MNLRHGIAAAALLSTALLTAACASTTAGTASVGPVTGSATSSSSSAASSSTASSSTAPSSTASPSSLSSPTAPTGQIDDTAIPAEPTPVVEPAALDATTGIWLQNSCTDIGTLFGALFALPAVDETAPLEEFRVAYRDYYATLADTVLGITDRMALLDPPTIAGGQALHDGYLAYLIGLADINAGASIAVDEAPDAETILAIVDQVDFETEQLGQGDFGLADFQGQELQALMAEVPACHELLAG